MSGINKAAQRKADALVDETGGLKATDGIVDGSGSADGSAAPTKKEQAARSDSRYDKDKCMVGYASQEEAVHAFLANYDDPRFLGPVTAMPVEEFNENVLTADGRMDKAESVLCQGLIGFQQLNRLYQPRIIVHRLTYPATDRPGEHAVCRIRSDQFR
jgi:hypothetical protein